MLIRVSLSILDTDLQLNFELLSDTKEYISENIKIISIPQCVKMVTVNSFKIERNMQDYTNTIL